MWSYLVDEKGRERAAIFYKAAFYDRDAHISITSRYSYSVEPACGYEDENYQSSEWIGVVKDAGKAIWQSPVRVPPEPKYNQENREPWRAWYDSKQELGDELSQWLSEHYPDWQNPTAYWEV
jgi:hypothetical protein